MMSATASMPRSRSRSAFNECCSANSGEPQDGQIFCPEHGRPAAGFEGSEASAAPATPSRRSEPESDRAAGGAASRRRGLKHSNGHAKAEEQARKEREAAQQAAAEAESLRVEQEARAAEQAARPAKQLELARREATEQAKREVSSPRVEPAGKPKSVAVGKRLRSNDTLKRAYPCRKRRNASRVSCSACLVTRAVVAR